MKRSKAALAFSLLSLKRPPFLANFDLEQNLFCTFFNSLCFTEYLGSYDLFNLLVPQCSEDHSFSQRERASGSGLSFRSDFMREPCGAVGVVDCLHRQYGAEIEPVAQRLEPSDGRAHDMLPEPRITNGRL